MPSAADASASMIIMKTSTMTSNPTGGGSCLAIALLTCLKKVTMKYAQASAESRKINNRMNFILFPPYELKEVNLQSPKN